MLSLDLVFVGITKSKRFMGVVIFTNGIESLISVTATGSFKGEAVLPHGFTSLSGLAVFSRSSVNAQVTS